MVPGLTPRAGQHHGGRRRARGSLVGGRANGADRTKGFVDRNCIFFTSDLGTNDSIEDFPVGRTLALDHWKGRLWEIRPLEATSQ